MTHPKTEVKGLLQLVATTLSAELDLPLMVYGGRKDHVDDVLILGHGHDDFLQLLIQVVSPLFTVLV